MYRKKDLAEIANAWNQIKAEEKNPKSWSLLADILLEAGDEEGAERTHNAYLDVLHLQIDELPYDLTLRKLLLDYTLDAFGKRDSRFIEAKKEHTRVLQYIEELANFPEFNPEECDEWIRVKNQNVEKSMVRYFLYVGVLILIGSSIWGTSVGVILCSLVGACVPLAVFDRSESDLNKEAERERVKYQAAHKENSALLQKILEAKKRLAPRRYIDEESLKSPMPPFIAYKQ